VSLGPVIKPVDGAAAPQTQGTTPEAQKLARLAGEFESMLLMQMLREMRKSGSWKDEDEDKAGFGAESLFETLDVEIASYVTKAQGFGLEKSLVRQVTGGGGAAPSGALPTTLPSLNLPTTGSSTPDDLRGLGSLDSHQGADGASIESHDPHLRGSGSLDPDMMNRVTTSPFGWRRDPFSGAATYHRGVDLRAAYGEPIGAADAGTVVFAGEQGGYGQTVVVEHAGGVRTRYAHLSSVTTQVGAAVQAGDAIGLAGRSGRATGTHLHFEVTQDGRPIDPQTYSPGGLKSERVTADWGVGIGPTPPGSPRRGAASE
jgi:murein DD-endopeptidase MepM/ murein hydrolase activator NlpD